MRHATSRGMALAGVLAVGGLLIGGGSEAKAQGYGGYYQAAPPVYAAPTYGGAYGGGYSAYPVAPAYSTGSYPVGYASSNYGGGYGYRPYYPHHTYHHHRHHRGCGHW